MKKHKFYLAVLVIVIIFLTNNFNISTESSNDSVFNDNQNYFSNGYKLNDQILQSIIPNQIIWLINEFSNNIEPTTESTIVQNVEFILPTIIPTFTSTLKPTETPLLVASKVLSTNTPLATVKPLETPEIEVIDETRVPITFISTLVELVTELPTNTNTPTFQPTNTPLSILPTETKEIIDIFFTNTPFPVITSTPFQTATWTPVVEVILTNTNTPYPTNTDVPVATVTPTFAPTATTEPTIPVELPTNTPKNTATSVPENTVIPVSTNTPTFIPTIPSSTWTLTPISTVTPTETNTSTEVPTNTNTPYPTNTETPSPTIIPTSTSTETPTWTPEPTFTSTETSTFTPTPTPTVTRTPKPLIPFFIPLNTTNDFFWSYSIDSGNSWELATLPDTQVGGPTGTQRYKLDFTIPNDYSGTFDIIVKGDIYDGGFVVPAVVEYDGTLLGQVIPLGGPKIFTISISPGNHEFQLLIGQGSSNGITNPIVDVDYTNVIIN